MNHIKIVVVIFFSITSCAYYNTFFNAEENYRAGLEKKENNTQDKIPADVIKHFDASIAKSWKVIDFYGDSSSWADDALFLIGKSYYQLEEYDKSQEILEQFLQKYLRSDLIPEAELWLAKTYLKREDNEQALLKFRSMISKTENDEIRAEAYLNMGELFFLSGEYEEAISNFTECINATSNSETAGRAQYKLADSYYQLDDYQTAIESYEEVLGYDLPIIKQYDSIIQMVNSLIELGNYERAEEILKTTLRDQRFKKHFSMIATKLANMIELQGDSNFAVENYNEVINTYPRTNGSALANFYIAQIYEFEFGWLDSAKIKYDQVKKQFSKSESAEEAVKRSKILADYIKIKKQLNKDRDDMFNLAHGDSNLVDSLVTGTDTLVVDQTDTTRSEANFGQAMQIANIANLKAEEDSLKIVTPKIKEKKIAVSRKPEVVEASLLKNDFRIAEFFLLNYQHYDSAKASYFHFVENHSDSLLTPKAYFSLYYIFKDIDGDSLTADSLKNIIIQNYPNTIYGKKLSGIETEELKSDNSNISKTMFLEAENLVDEQKFIDAINVFNEVAINDSGSVWATKSRYASAYIYENYLEDINNALESYRVLAKEYPQSEQGKIAKNKIAEPPEEKIEPAPSDSTQSLNTLTPDSTLAKPDVLPQNDENPIND
ncbi:MAG: outer membrane protein assembly factor BamD [Calditrichaeota bacterium]|nr:MAG: outer membrane protein assembly factor BamD [Calditrichota bacterium]MBL1204181.1 outer membrane protein assembly factor BamD [Calditrichota bacterium]NOG44011.1 tetratricopeptide repeat protein [Calditrichota bacterium]